MTKIIIFFYLILSTLTLLYSYGFVDFNLTLTTHPLVNQFISWSQQLAMFDRTNSTYVYLTLVSSFFLLYIVIISLYQGKKFPWLWVMLIALICSLAYPMLSSDVFKYLFSAKTVVLYHANPHQVAPQVFEGDLWLRFMRWIHTPSPYGPFQTALAIPYYVISLGKFTPMLYLYKFDQLFWYVLSIWSLGKLGVNVRSRLFFALNPLILIEWLVNAHNDAIMISLALFSLVAVRQGRGILAWISLILSIGVKYITVIFLPIIIIFKKLTTLSIAYWSLIILFLAPLLYHYSYQYQPWYVTWLIPFAALSASPVIMGLTTAYSFGALLRYLPFIQTGLWQGSALYFALLTFLPLLLAIFYYSLVHVFRHNKQL